MKTPRSDLYRSTPPMEVRDGVDGRLTLQGHFSVFDSPTEINSAYEGRFIERIAPGAFTKTLKERAEKIRIMFNHGRSSALDQAVIARATEISEDNQGGYYEALLFRGLPEWLYEGLRENQYGASFRFEAVRDAWEDTPGRSEQNPEGLPERTVTEAKLFELGPVSWPAYADATASIRSLSDHYHDLRTSTEAAPPEGTRPVDAAPQPSPETPPAAPQHLTGLTPAEREAVFRSITI